MKSLTQFVFLMALAVAAGPHAVAQTKLSLPAQVEPYERATIFSKASGYVSAVHVDIGDAVEKGQLLAELSIPEMEQKLLQKSALVEQADAAIQQAEARVAAAKARVAASESQVTVAKSRLDKHKADIDFANSELTRITALVASRAVNASIQDEKQQQLSAAEAAFSGAQAEVQSAESDIRVAQAGLKQADADLVYAHSQRKVADASMAYTVAMMQYAKIHAPFSGTISQRGIDTGDFVISAASSRVMAASLFTLNRIDRFRIVFDVPESTATQIVVGQAIELVIDSVKNRTYAGEIKRTTGELDKRTRTLRVEAELNGEQPQLRPGMYGTVTFTLRDE